jgi:sialate O-acetylesterase
MVRFGLGFLAASLIAAPVAAAPMLHPIFNDHAVLQRDTPIPVYGQAAPGAKVTVHLGQASASALAGRDGVWRVSLPAMKAGGGYTLTASDGHDSQMISDVLVGDVFLCTGQSNMQVTVRRAGNAEAEIAAATDGDVRQLTVGLTASAEKLASFATPVAWHVESPQTAADFSASCFFFARSLRKAHPDVPVGLLTVAWGGTRERGWIATPTLRSFDYYKNDLDMLALYRRDPAAAAKAWDMAWENAWHAHAPTSPWKEDTSSWIPAPAAMGPWGEWPGLSLPDGSAEPGVGYVGQIWLAAHVRLTAAQAAQPATLDLGKVNEEEKSWVNGTGTGGSSQEPDARHPLPAGLLRSGDNLVTLNIFCSWKNCGLNGPDVTRAIRFADGSSAALDAWRYRTADDWIAPQLPWGPMHGIGLQYNGMIAPIGPYGVKAAIWYQGESNLYFAQHYQAGLTALMADWRAQFGAQLPFVIVQIPQYGLAPTAPAESLWSDVREAQRRTAAADAHAALTVNLDIGDAKNLHPANKQEVGRRIALAIRGVTYGEPVATGPRAVAARRSGNQTIVDFAGTSGKLLAYNGQPNAFELCDGASCRWASAHIQGDHVALDGTAAKVRYCWGDAPVCTLTDASALPAGPFELPVQ